MAPEAWANALYVLDKLTPALVSAVVAFAILHIGRRRERRKLSLDMYKEFYSPDFSESRYAAERYFDSHPNVDWASTDPYDLPDPDGTRKGYAAVTRYFARLSVLYEEGELDRRFTERLMSRMAGYWYGLVYERMAARERMYTGASIVRLCGALRQGSRAQEFDRGYKDGFRRAGRRPRGADGTVAV